MADFALVLFCWRGRGRTPWKGRISYAPPLVNMQARAIRRCMSKPFELVCVTDYPAHEFDSSIRIVDADVHFAELADLGKCYRRLKAFDPSMKELFAPRFAWLDLDAVFVRDMAPLFDVGDTVKCWKSESLSGQPINGSILYQVAGAHAHVWRDFDVSKTPASARMQGYRGSDQACIAVALGKEVPVWTWQDGVMHLGRHCGRGTVPDLARVIFSPGGAKVTDPVVQHRYPWLKALLHQDMQQDERPPGWAVGEWTDRHPDDKPRTYRVQWRRMQEVRQEMRAQAVKDREARR